MPITIIIPDPVKLPLCSRPDRYEQETDKQYGDRIYRWRVWLNTEPRPAFWFAGESEIKEYQTWRNSNPTKSPERKPHG